MRAMSEAEVSAVSGGHVTVGSYLCGAIGSIAGGMIGGLVGAAVGGAIGGAIGSIENTGPVTGQISDTAAA